MIEPAKIHVRFTDLDVLGHVNNNIYLSYFEIARVHYFGKLLGKEWDWKTNTVVLAKNEVEYLIPVTLGHEPIVVMKVEHIGTKSFTLTYELFVDDTVYAMGRSILVAFNGVKQTSTPIHPEMKKALELLKKEQ